MLHKTPLAPSNKATKRPSLPPTRPQNTARSLHEGRLACSPASSSTMPHPRRPRPLLSRSTLMRGWMPRERLGARGQGMARRSIYGPESPDRFLRETGDCALVCRAPSGDGALASACRAPLTCGRGRALPSSLSPRPPRECAPTPPRPTMEWPRLRSATFAAPGPRSRREASPSPRSPLGSVGTGSHAPAPGFSDAGCEPESRTQPAAVVYSLL